MEWTRDQLTYPADEEAAAEYIRERLAEIRATWPDRRFGIEEPYTIPQVCRGSVRGGGRKIVAYEAV